LIGFTPEPAAFFTTGARTTNPVVVAVAAVLKVETLL
jgi:hypothetical protein